MVGTFEVDSDLVRLEKGEQRSGEMHVREV